MLGSEELLLLRYVEIVKLPLEPKLNHVGPPVKTHSSQVDPGPPGRATKAAHFTAASWSKRRSHLFQ